MSSRIYLVLIFLFWIFFYEITASDVIMRVVHDVNTGGPSWNNNRNPLASASKTLKPRIKEIKASGPSLFLDLDGQCFAKEISGYRYSFCPFHNITQLETGFGWNKFEGILGIFQGWNVNISDNSYTSMSMKGGDACGNISRVSEVKFICGNLTELVEVSEPKTCQYAIIFSHPHACNPHAFLLYPSLSHKSRKHWDTIYSEYGMGYLTLKGYEADIMQLLIDAGVIVLDTFVEKSLVIAATLPGHTLPKNESDLQSQIIALQQALARCNCSLSGDNDGGGT